MPIKVIDISSPPGFLVQICAGCGTERSIGFDRGAVETKTGPFTLPAQAALELLVDASHAVTISLPAGALDAAGLNAKLTAVAHVHASESAGRVVIESATTGANSRVEVTGGNARQALGFPEGLKDPSPGRPMLGVAIGGLNNSDAICLRRCACGTNEVLNRTWDVAPAALAGTPFYEHRRAVNTLAEHFKAQGWVHPDLAAKLQAEIEAPPDRLPTGTKLFSVPLETRG